MIAYISALYQQIGDMQGLFCSTSYISPCLANSCIRAIFPKLKMNINEIRTSYKKKQEIIILTYLVNFAYIEQNIHALM